jgi:uncharacterized protein (TIGR03435 family)
VLVSAEMARLSSAVPLIVLLLMVVTSSQSQSPPSRAQFEVASVRLNTSGERAVSIGSPSPGRFNAQNVWLRFLIQTAWKVRDFQVSGGPAWATSDRFDISAKAATGASFEEMRPMLQALLEDRFHLTLHNESKDLPAYALVVGKSGAKLQPSKEGSCANPPSDASQPAGTRGQNLPICGSMGTSPRSLTGTGISTAQLAALSNTMQRTVIDQTGLSGYFDVHMEWTADQSTPGFWAPGLRPTPGTGAAPGTDPHPTLAVGRYLL